MQRRVIGKYLCVTVPTRGVLCDQGWLHLMAHPLADGSFFLLGRMVLCSLSFINQKDIHFIIKPQFVKFTLANGVSYWKYILCHQNYVTMQERVAVTHYLKPTLLSCNHSTCCFLRAIANTVGKYSPTKPDSRGEYSWNHIYGNNNEVRV